MNFTKSGFMQSFKTKAFKRGAYSTLATAAAIAFLIAANLLAQRLDIRADLTKDKLYSISDETREILDGLTQDVNVYPLFGISEDDAVTDMIKEIINQYGAYSKRVTVTYKDPSLNPQFALNYAADGAEIPDGSIIVACGEQVKVIPVGDLATIGTDYQVTSVDVEPQLSNAILYVTRTDTPVVCNLTGHGEMPLPESFQKEISKANYDVTDIDLFNEEKMPEDCGLLIVTTPSQDWTPEEARKVSDYLARGGRALFLLDHTEAPMDNLKGVLAAYGAGLGGAFLAEGDASRFVQNKPLNILPVSAETEPARAVLKQDYHVLTPYAQAVVETTEAGPKKENVTFEPVLITSKSVYAKTAPDIQSVSKEPGDTDGPFSVAAAITAETAGVSTKIFVLGNSYVLDESVNVYVGGDNYRFLINAMNWTQDEEGSVSILPKTGAVQALPLSNRDVLLLAFTSVVGLPLVILGAGLAVWLKRRNS